MRISRNVGIGMAAAGIVGIALSGATVSLFEGKLESLTHMSPEHAEKIVKKEKLYKAHLIGGATGLAISFLLYGVGAYAVDRKDEELEQVMARSYRCTGGETNENRM